MNIKEKYKKLKKFISEKPYISKYTLKYSINIFLIFLAAILLLSYLVTKFNLVSYLNYILHETKAINPVFITFDVFILISSIYITAIIIKTKKYYFVHIFFLVLITSFICGRNLFLIPFNLLNFSILLLIYFLFIFQINYLNKINNNKSFFIQDYPENEIDLLDFKNDAKDFADKVIDNYSMDSIVFGLDAPWGSGKSTYINYCKQYWKTKKNVRVIEFNPLKFNKSADLFTEFISHLSVEIKKDSFSQFRLFKKYVRSIGVKFGGFDIGLPFSFSEKNENEAFNDLYEILEHSSKKIIFIIDDLDRIDVDDIKLLLDLVRKTFILPNLSYILCYDIENLNSFKYSLKSTTTTSSSKNEDSNTNSSNSIDVTKTKEVFDSTKIIEYFEKMVNIKKSIFPKPENIKDYFFSNLIDITKNIDQEIDDIKFRQIIERDLNNIFQPKYFYKYFKYLGDLRKVKRVLNIFKMILSKIDRYENISLIDRDINYSDLLNLIIIYTNYPSVFRKIFITQSSGGDFFCCERDYTNGRFSLKNSKEYFGYLSQVSDDEKFLIENIFGEQKLKEASDFDRNSDNRKFSCAVYDHVLKYYLTLITEGNLPSIEDEMSFHYNKANAYLSKTNENLKTFIENVTFYNFSKNINFEVNQKYFFSNLLNSLNNINQDKLEDIFNYIIENINQYSFIACKDNEGVFYSPLRDSLIMDLVDLISNFYKGDVGRLLKIKQLILGVDNDASRSILNRLLNNENILGLYNMLSFRLRCNNDRGGRFYDVYEALAGKSNYNLDEQMKDISVKCFDLFKNNYIDFDKNIFKEIDDLTERDLLGGFYNFISDLGDDFNLKSKIELVKNGIKTFIIYQLSNDIVDMGVGCGHFDCNNEKIKVIMNRYLFEKCFLSVEGDNIGFIYFVDFMLLHYCKDHYTKKLTFDLAEINKIMDKNLLTDYWSKNGENIKQSVEDLITADKKIIERNNYGISYGNSAHDLFEVLDVNFKI